MFWTKKDKPAKKGKPEYAYSYELNVAGVTKAGRQRIVRELFPGIGLQLVREPDNRHDPNAVAVYCEGDQVGYVPAGKSRMVAEYMDRGKAVDASVVDIHEWEDDAGRTRLGVLMFLGIDRQDADTPEGR